MSQHPFEGQAARKDYDELSPRASWGSTGGSTGTSVARDLRPVPPPESTPAPGQARTEGDKPDAASNATADPARVHDDQGAEHRAETAPSPSYDTRLADVFQRLERVERTNRYLRVGCLLAIAGALAIGIPKFLTEETIIKQTLMESKELTLVDNSGNARLFLRMFSKVPVLQLMDANGKPRMSLGLRFDDTPFIDLSDKRGRTRATFEMTEDDSPALRLFNARGDVTFSIN
ncbi:MAG: hypothetical protein KDK91_00950 [Gammaproteobacteria bacterium]|nr:hypothetical protein [Gammaproteobacteria bacterium]